jgi:hypothetical protein
VHTVRLLASAKIKMVQIRGLQLILIRMLLYSKGKIFHGEV